MKSSVPLLLISSAISLPLSFEAIAEEAASSTATTQTPSNGNITLGPKDDYPGTTTSEPFTVRSTSDAAGTTYTLDGDVTFNNVAGTKTADAAAGGSQTQAQPSQDNTSGQQEGGTANSDSAPAAAAYYFHTDTYNNPFYYLSSDAATQNSGTSGDSATTTTPATNTSCFSNTDGSLTFTGANHSMSFSNVSITGKGSAISNAANSALTFSGFDNLSFTNATKQDQTQADSAVYSGPKAAVPGTGTAAGSSNGTSSGIVSSAVAASGVAAEPTPTSAPSIAFTNNVNVTFTGNSSKESGGAVRVEGNGNISNNTGTVTFSGNNAKQYGGAVCLSGDLTISGNNAVVFSGNQAQTVATAPETGGGAAASAASQEGKAQEEASESEPTPAENTDNNQPAAQEGSVVAAKYVFMTSGTGGADSSSGTDNSASADDGKGYGGAICCIGQTQNPPASPPAAKQASGDVAVQTPTVNITNNTSVTFSKNAASTVGGAIFTGHLVLSGGQDVTFSENSAGEGGAASVYGATEIENNTGTVTFSGNQSVEEGGALYVRGNLTVSGNGTVVFSKNKSGTNPTPPSQPGAAASVVPVVQAASPDSATADQNTAGGADITKSLGGAIFCVGQTQNPPASNPSSQAPAGTSSVQASATVDSKQTAGNTPKTPSVVNITKNTSVTFSDNSSLTSGGAIFTEKLTLSGGKDVSFLTNSSGEGGAVTVKGDAEIKDNTGTITFSGNTSKKEGGALCTNGNLTISGNGSVVFSGNKSETPAQPAAASKAAETVALKVESPKQDGQDTEDKAAKAPEVQNSAVQNSVESSAFRNIFLAAEAQDSAAALTNTDTSQNTNTPAVASRSLGGAIYCGGESTEPVPPSDGTFFVTTLTNNNTLTFSQNSSTDRGGAIVTEKLTLSGSKNATFSENTSGEGGALYVTADTGITENGNVVFSGNQATSTTAEQGNGGAIYCLTPPPTTSGTPSSPVQSGAPTGSNDGQQAAALYTAAAAAAPSTGQVTTPPADACLTISGNKSVTFSGNSAKGKGGAIYTKKLVLSSGGEMLFSNNTASEGGAIFIVDGGSVDISASQGNITFEGNTVTTAANPSVQADTADAADTTPPNPVHNAVHVGAGSLFTQLRAGTGHSLTFYDPITTTEPQAPVTKASSSAAPAPALLKLNAQDTATSTPAIVYDGRIVFSGEKLTPEEAADPANLTSFLHHPVSLEAGTLVLKGGATLSVLSFAQQPGTLVIMDGGTTIDANVPMPQAPVTVNANPSADQKDAPQSVEVKPVDQKDAPAGENGQPADQPADSASSQPADQPKSLDASSQLARVVAKYLVNKLPAASAPVPAAPAPAVQATPVTAADGSIVINNLAVNLDSLGNGQVITITGGNGTGTGGTGTAGNVSITGDLQFVDANGGFYDNPLLSKNFSANLLSVSTGTGGKVDTTGFNIVPQGSTTSNFGYQGQWDVVQVTDAATGAISFEIKWLSAGYKPDPERRATLVPNSLWCSAIDIQSVQKIIEVSSESRNSKGLWVAGVSNFFHRDASKIQKGFRHISSGYVLGASFESIEDDIFDFGFCQLFGRDKDYHLGRTKSHVYAVSLHTKQDKMVHRYGFSNRKGVIFSRLPEQFPVTFDAQLSYSVTHNTMTTKHATAPTSKGTWNNHCVSAELGSMLPRELFSPYMKLHVVFVEQENFKETKGGDRNREFQSSRLTNVALPIGVKLEKATSSNDFGLSIAFHPDIYRHYPKSHVFLPSGNNAWTTGATNLARQAVLVEGSTHHHLADSFEIFSHGAFELRGSSRSYNADLGGKYKF
ncbi:polymorphic outer membrane protein middle domain-containing protein [Chlamydia vaughanii]|uniref:polymorphic outer membrane protein middle domain-containing protein n=1 Tax=Chlamydia vaughanii TaxID=3112552 RepID=UPI0032B1BD38